MVSTGTIWLPNVSVLTRVSRTSLEVNENRRSLLKPDRRAIGMFAFENKETAPMTAQHQIVRMRTTMGNKGVGRFRCEERSDAPFCGTTHLYIIGCGKIAGRCHGKGHDRGHPLDERRAGSRPEAGGQSRPGSSDLRVRLSAGPRRLEWALAEGPQAPVAEEDHRGSRRRGRDPCLRGDAQEWRPDRPHAIHP